MKDMLAGARPGHYAVCYCEAWNLESLQFLSISCARKFPTHSKMRSLHPPRRICARRRRWCYHQAQTLQQHHRPLRRCTPDELATFALAVLYVDVAAGILQAAILERAIDKDPVVKDQVLVFEDFVFVSSHQKSRLPLPGSGRKLRVDA